jgi:hypothetical protein
MFIAFLSTIKISGELPFPKPLAVQTLLDKK